MKIIATQKAKINNAFNCLRQKQGIGLYKKF